MEFIAMETDVILFLAFAALVAGFVDSIAGGGGLVALPALLLAGLDPVAALATNKLQGSFGTASATFTFWRKGMLNPKAHFSEILTVFLGAGLGVLAVGYLPTHILNAAMPVLLIAIAIYFAVSPHIANHSSKPRLQSRYFAFGFAPAIGFYDGVFGPGTGSFFMLALVALFGCNLVEATGRTKLLNFTSNFASLMLFALGGKIVWTVGLAMGLAQVIGAQLGARLAIRNGATIIRPLLVFVCVAMAIRLMWRYFA
jgi:uncharacterized protein